MTTTSVPSPTLHHINLKTTRLREMVDWYGMVTGVVVTHLAETGAWLTNDAANHRIALLAVPGLIDDPAKLEHTGMHHSAYAGEFSPDRPLDLRLPTPEDAPV